MNTIFKKVLTCFTAGLPRLTMGTEITTLSQGGKKRKLDEDTYTLTVSLFT